MKTNLKNEVLEEIWKIKDKIVREHDFDIDSISRHLKKREKRHKKDIVNFSRKEAKVA